MSGIKEAMQRVMKRTNKGEVLALGEIRSCEKYMIVQIYNVGKEAIFVYDGGDVQFQDNIKVSDEVELVITSNYTAEWKAMESKWVSRL